MLAKSEALKSDGDANVVGLTATSTRMYLQNVTTTWFSAGPIPDEPELGRIVLVEERSIDLEVAPGALYEQSAASREKWLGRDPTDSLLEACPVKEIELHDSVTDIGNYTRKMMHSVDSSTSRVVFD